MDAINPVEMRLLLDRNPNALKAAPHFAAGARLDPGLYWSAAAAQTVSVEQPVTADVDLYRLHRNPAATLTDLVHTIAVGGGGRTGDPEAARRP